jgi:hypothetical protein
MPSRFRTAVILLIMVPVCMLILPGCSKKNDISGNWQGKVTLPATGRTLPGLQITLTQKGTEVSGIMLFPEPGAKLSLHGTCANGKILLTAPMNKGLGLSLEGTLETRKKITGTAILDYDAPSLGKKQDKVVVEMTR